MTKVEENYIAKAIRYRKSIRELGLPQSVYASRIGVSQGYMCNTLRILKFNKKILKYIKHYGMAQWRAFILLRSKDLLTDEQMIKIIKYNKFKDLSAEQFEKLIKYEVDRPVREGVDKIMEILGLDEQDGMN